MKEIIFATGNTSKGKRFEKGLLSNNIKTITLYKDIDKYLTEINDEDKVKIKVDETDVVNFIVNSINK